MSITLTPEVEFQDWDVDHKVKKTSWLPGIGGNIGWGINRTNSLSLYAWYNLRAPGAQMRNDLTLRETELKWIEGNPSMKTDRYQTVSLSWFTSPLKWLNSTVSFGYSTHSGEYMIRYRSGGEAYDGVIGQYAPGDRSDSFNFYWNLAAGFFGGKLNFGSQLQYTYQKWNFPGSPRSAYWYERPSISWRFGNCSLYGWYASPQKWAFNGGTEESTYPHQYGLIFSYGNGNFNLDVEANNIFTKNMNSDRWFASGPYSFTERNWCGGRNVAVSLTYTFDYGKKVDPGVNIYEEDIKSTSVLGSGK